MGEIGNWLDDLFNLPLITGPATSRAEGDDVNIGTFIFVP
jgi:hypothetical protein